MQREKIFHYVKNQYGTELEYLWKDTPDEMARQGTYKYWIFLI